MHINDEIEKEKYLIRLRDEMAMYALNGLISDGTFARNVSEYIGKRVNYMEEQTEMLSKIAYMFADSMIKERNEKDI